jgi:uncharacterized protein (UPF0333 family)
MGVLAGGGALSYAAARGIDGNRHQSAAATAGATDKPAAARSSAAASGSVVNVVFIRRASLRRHIGANCGEAQS